MWFELCFQIMKQTFGFVFGFILMITGSNDAFWRPQNKKKQKRTFESCLLLKNNNHRYNFLFID